jgi:hypothetical protein
MNGFDIQAALEIANKFRGIAHRADTFGHDRARILEELIFAAENYESLAERIEASMLEEV